MRRKSDLPLYIVKSMLFILTQPLIYSNDNVNTKSIWLNNLIDVCLWYCIETTWTMFQTVLKWEVNKDNSIHKSVLVELGFYLWYFNMTMGGTASFCTGVPSMTSSNKIRSFRENSAENTEQFTKMCHSPLRPIHPVPNRWYQEVEVGEKYVWQLYRVLNQLP